MAADFISAIVQGAAGHFNGWMNGILQQGETDAESTINDANTYAQNLINNTNADAANKVRDATNQFAAAQASLSNLTRSLGNQRKMEAAGSQVEAINTNLDRLQDQAVRGDLTARVQASEQMGAVRAAAAAAGVGGTSAQMLQKTMELSLDQRQTVRNENRGYQTYDMLMQRAGLMGNMVSSLDEGQTFAPIDYSVNVAPLVQSPILAGQFAFSPDDQGMLGMASALAGSSSFTSAMSNMSWGGGSTGGSTGNSNVYVVGNGIGNKSSGSSWNWSTSTTDSVPDYSLQ